MMKNTLLIFLLIGLAATIQAQIDPTIDKGSGWLYFSGIPGTTPSVSSGSEAAINLNTREAYIWNRDSSEWQKWLLIDSVAYVSDTLRIWQNGSTTPLYAVIPSGTIDTAYLSGDTLGIVFAGDTTEVVLAGLGDGNGLFDASNDGDTTGIGSVVLGEDLTVDLNSYDWLFDGLVEDDTTARIMTLRGNGSIAYRWLDSLLNGYTTGSGTPGTLPIWTGANAMGNSSVTESGGNVIGTSFTGAFGLATGTTAQAPVGANGRMRYNTTENGISAWNGTAAAWQYLPWADADNWAANRVPYSDGNQLTSSSSLQYISSYFLVGSSSSGIGTRIRVVDNSSLATANTQVWAMGIQTTESGSGSGTGSGIGIQFRNDYDGSTGKWAGIRSYATDGFSNGVGMAFHTTGFQGTTPLAIMTSTGLGIKNTAPSVELHVTGQARITNLPSTLNLYEVRADANGNLTRQVGSYVGAISTSTDASGDIVVAHGMGVTPTSVQVTVTGTTPYLVTVHSVDATNFTVRFYDTSGAAVVSTAVTATWHGKT